MPRARPPRASHLPQVAALRNRMWADVDVFGRDAAGGIDCKSERDTGEGAIARSRQHLEDDLRLNGAREGLPVFLTPGCVETVCLSKAPGDS